MKPFLATLKILFIRLFKEKKAIIIIALYYLIYFLIIVSFGYKEFLTSFYGAKIFLTSIFLVPSITLTFNNNYLIKSYVLAKSQILIDNSIFILSHIFIIFMYAAVLFLPALISDYYHIQTVSKSSFIFFAFEEFKNIVIILFYFTISFGYGISTIRKYMNANIEIPNILKLQRVITSSIFFTNLFLAFIIPGLGCYFNFLNLAIRISAPGLMHLKQDLYNTTFLELPYDVWLTFSLCLVSIALYKYVILKNISSYILVIEGDRNN